MNEEGMGISYYSLKRNWIRERMGLLHMFLEGTPFHHDLLYGGRSFFTRKVDEIGIGETHVERLEEVIFQDDPSIIRTFRKTSKRWF